MGGFGRLFVELRGSIPNPSRREQSRQVWISPETWKLINTRVVACRSRDGKQGSVQMLIRQIKAKLRGERRRRAAEAGSVVESLLDSDPPLIREVWIRM